MKKIIFGLLILILASVAVYALDLETSGEVRTGLYAERKDDQTGKTEKNILWNNDGESGFGEAQIRLGFKLLHENLGIRVQFIQTGTTNEVTQSTRPYSDNPNEYNPYSKFQISNFKSEYLYAWGNLFNDQVTISGGMLDEHPWGLDGDELFEDLGYVTGGERKRLVGIRTEFKPTFINFLNGLNFGFVLNMYNFGYPPQEKKKPHYDILKESLVGAAYENDYLALRFSWRFDSRTEADLGGEQDGMEFLYRVEERALDMVVPGLQIMLDGHRRGISSALVKDDYFINWLYCTYDPGNYAVKFNAMLEEQYTNKSLMLMVNPIFIYRLFNEVLEVGLEGGMLFGIRDNASSKIYNDSFYNSWFVEPMIQVNFSSSSYMGLHYNYSQTYVTDRGDMSKLHWINLRMVFSL